MTARLILAPLSRFTIPDHQLAETFASWLNDPEVVRFSEQRHFQHSAESQLDYWNTIITEPIRYWLIRTKGDKPRTIGATEARFDEFNLTSNLSILLGDKDCWGKGYGKEAFAAVIENERLHGIQKVEAGMMATNEPMKRTCKACEMMEEGLIPDHFLEKGSRIALIQMGRPV